MKTDTTPTIMKKINLTKPTFIQKLGTTKLNYVGMLILGLLLGVLTTSWLNNLTTHNTFKWQLPIVLQSPLVVQKIPDINLILKDSSNSAQTISSPSASPKQINMSVEDKVRKLTMDVWGKSHVEAMLNIIRSESNFRYNALNPNGGACGIPQALPCSKMGCGLTAADVDCQLNWMISYIKNRYNDPIAAWNFHLWKGWY